MAMGDREEDGDQTAGDDIRNQKAVDPMENIQRAKEAASVRSRPTAGETARPNTFFR